MLNDESWLRYEGLRLEFPELFVNPDDNVIRIVSAEEEVRSVKDFRDWLLTERSLPDHWNRLGVVFEDEYLIVIRDPVFIAGRGGFRSYLRIIEKPLSVPAVALFALYQGQLVILHHFRHAVRAWSLEIPRGLGTSGDWREDAARELLEEVGGTAQNFENVGPLCTNSGIFGTIANLVFADLTEIDQTKISQQEQDPGIGKIELVSPKRFLDYIRSGRIFDTYTLSAACLMAAAGFDSRWVGGDTRTQT
jgi:ADP-ribose pyrophosphatase